MTDYEFHIDPDAYARFSTVRHTVTEGDDLTITDCTSGYIRAGAVIGIIGTLPDAGTYVRQDGETVTQFLERVFKEQAAGRVTLNYRTC